MVNVIHTKIIPKIAHLWVRKTRGVENIPKEKMGFIVAANHASYLDHFIVGGTVVLATKRMVYFLAKKEHFEGSQRAWHEFLRAIPIDRESGGKKALAKAVKALKQGKIIMIYPEGTRTTTGKLNRAKTGIARLVLAAKVPVLPIGMVGTFKILPIGKWIPKFKRAEINVGKLMYFDKYYGKEKNYKTLRLISNNVMKDISKLCKQKYNFK